MMDTKKLKHTYFYQPQQSEIYHPVYIFHIVDTYNPEMIICNWHEDVEAVLVLHGCLHLYIDEVLYEMKEGDICFINSNCLHYGQSSSTVECDVLVFLFRLKDLLLEAPHNDAHLVALADGLLRFPSSLPQTHPIYNDVRCVLEELLSVWMDEPPAYEIKIRSLLFDLVFQFATHESCLITEPGWDSSKEKERLLAINTYLSEHLSERFTIRVLAEHLLMSQESFYKFMINTVGMPPIVYINLFRLNHAASLLQTTDQSVTEVCFQSGFQNVSYFIRSFKKQFGCTPKQYTLKNSSAD